MKTGVLMAVATVAGILIGARWGGMEEARAHREVIASDVFVQEHLDFIFDSCLRAADASKRKREGK